MRLLLILLVALLCSSCYIHRHNHGNFERLKNDHKTNRYDRNKQFYLLWGLAPLGNANVDKPDTTAHYRIVSKNNVGDFFFNTLFGGFLSMRTVKVEVIDFPDQQGPNKEKRGKEQKEEEETDKKEKEEDEYVPFLERFGKDDEDD